MESPEIIRQQVFEVVDNQIRDGKPVETKQTYNRLLKMGYSSIDAKKYIGQCVLLEMYNILKHDKSFDEKRYVRNLLKLPEEPDEESCV